MSQVGRNLVAGILEDGPLRKALRGTRLLEAPTLFRGAIEGDVMSAIAEEKEAIDDYADLESKLRRAGDNTNADIVKEIRNDELDHREKFQRMLERMQARH